VSSSDVLEAVMSTYETTRAIFPVRRAAQQVDFIAGVRLLFRAWRKRARDRRELALMGERGLRDIAADQATIELEVPRPFWQKSILGRR
jgi:uncharacterized protein YjiS (DUF1127 family)